MTGHALRTHKKYAASSASRWMLCHGSVRASQGVPDVPSSYSIDGTQAHELLDFALRNNIESARQAYGMMPEAQEWTLSQEDLDERIDAVDVCLDHVYDILDSYPDAILYVERQLEFPSKLMPGEVGGTTDITIIVPSLELMFVIDYKHGKGVWVPVEENKQLLMYGTQAWKASPHKITTVVLTVVQPRHTSQQAVRSWITTTERLDKFIYEVDDAILACEQDDAQFVVDEEKCCKFCPINTICAARKTKAYEIANPFVNFNAVKVITRDMLPDKETLGLLMTPEELANAKATIDTLRAFATDIEGVMYDYMRNGGKVPGYKLVETQARRKWEGDEDTLAVTLSAMAEVPLDKVYTRKLITITEAQKLVVAAAKAKVGRAKKKEAATEAINAFALLTTKDTSGNLTIAPDTDARPSFDAPMVNFGKVEVIPLESMEFLSPSAT